jgi:hypothetical protein
VNVGAVEEDDAVLGFGVKFSKPCIYTRLHYVRLTVYKRTASCTPC